MPLAEPDLCISHIRLFGKAPATGANVYRLCVI